MSHHLAEIENSLLLSRWLPAVPLESELQLLNSEYIAYLTTIGNHEQVLSLEQVNRRLQLAFPPSDNSRQSLAALLWESPTAIDDDELLLLCIAICLLQLFVRVNWTGPSLDPSFSHDSLLFSSSDDPASVHLNSIALRELSCSGEPAYHLCSLPACLRLAQIILDRPSWKEVSQRSVDWWKMRVALIWNRVLDEAVVLPSSFPPVDGEVDGQMNARLLLEQGMVYHQVGQHGKAHELFIQAGEATGLEWSVSGMLGKKTRWQVEEKSQLVVVAKGRGAESETSKGAAVPESLKLNDDTLLESVHFTQEQNDTQHKLSPLDQTILLALTLHLSSTSPQNDVLTKEEVTAFVERIIRDPGNWSVHTMALLMRSRVEGGRTRTMERGALQLHALVDQINPTLSATPGDAAESDADFRERIEYFWQLGGLPTRWALEKELAKRYEGMGVIRSALEIYERLEMWEDVVRCWQSLEDVDKAVRMVRELIEGTGRIESDEVLRRARGRNQAMEDKARLAKLWCILGDLEASHAEEHYKKAWEISEQTSARSMRSLGGLFFSQGNYQEAITCLEKSVKVHGLNAKVWFILGCCWMRVEGWDGAREAFSRCLQIGAEEVEGECWANLAGVWLRMEAEGLNVAGDHSNTQMAYIALSRALKYSPDNWKMWTNYVVVSARVGEYAECVKGMGRTVELTKGVVVGDAEILDKIVGIVEESGPWEGKNGDEETLEDKRAALRNPNTGIGLAKHLFHFFEEVILPRLSPQNDDAPRIYDMYSRLLRWMGRRDEAVKATLDAWKLREGKENEVENLDKVITMLKELQQATKAASLARRLVGRWKREGRDMDGDQGWETLKALAIGVGVNV